ncbi:hypothetical protein ANCDUO_18766, partial [Ancylostoma duodenale]
MKVKKHHKVVESAPSHLDDAVADIPGVEATTPKAKKKKKEKPVEESSLKISEDVSPAPSKKKKRANKSVPNDSITEDVPKKKKKRSSVEPSRTTLTEQPEEEIPVFKGETVIKPRKQKKEQVKEPVASEETKSQEEQKEEKVKDRTKQRENRKKAHEQRMTLEEKKRTLFVGNAPISMDERDCKKLFSQYGPIESVRMRSVMPTKETITKRIAHISHNFHEKQTSVNFYVKFKDEESVQKALAYNGTILDRHRIRVDTCTSKAEYDRKLTVFV